MKVTKWTYWNNNKYKDINELTDDEFKEVEETIIKEIKDKGYKFCGSAHQNIETGCPVIDDKYIYCVSMRKWGDIMARAYDLPNEDGLAYVLWSWAVPDGETSVYP